MFSKLSKKVIFVFCSIFLLVATYSPFLSSMQRSITFDNIASKKYAKTKQLYIEITKPNYSITTIERLSKDPDVDINIQAGPFLNTLLHTAIINKHSTPLESDVISIISILLNNRTLNLVLTNSEGNTPLHSAIEEGYFTVAIILIRAMIERNFDLNTQNNHGDTALHLATKENQYEPVEQLLQAPGIQINLQNHEHKTATDLANDLGFKRIEEFLIQHGGILMAPSSVSRVNSEAQFAGEIFQMDL